MSGWSASLLACLRWGLLACCVWCGSLWAADTETIVNNDRSGLTIDRDTLRAIYTTRLRQWPDGRPIRVFVLPDDNPLHDEFCREQLGMYPYVLRDLWNRLEFTGTGLTPTLVRSEEEMRARVKDTPGAIGYVFSGSARRGAPPTHATPAWQDSSHQP